MKIAHERSKDAVAPTGLLNTEITGRDGRFRHEVKAIFRSSIFQHPLRIAFRGFVRSYSSADSVFDLLEALGALALDTVDTLFTKLPSCLVAPTTALGHST